MAPHWQKRKATIDRVSTLCGFALEGAAVFIAWVNRLGPGEPPSLARVIASMAIGPFGGALAWFAVKHLGRQWRITAGVWEDHSLVQRGPYSLVRHPVYASLLLLLLSTLLLLTPWMWVAISLALFIIGTEIRIRGEERLLAERFGAEFENYRRQVRAYIPFVR